MHNQATEEGRGASAARASTRASPAAPHPAQTASTQADEAQRPIAPAGAECVVVSLLSAAASAPQVETTGTVRSTGSSRHNAPAADSASLQAFPDPTSRRSLPRDGPEDAKEPASMICEEV